MTRHWSWNLDSLAELAAVKFLAGSNAALSGILVAHELIHRRHPLPRRLGRLLLILCGHDHFYVEHRRGHHRRVGLAKDPATARPGESYADFWRRSLRGQFRGAWQLECRRLRRKHLGWHHHRVLQGLAAEGALLGLVVWFYGAAGAVAVALQAFMAMRNLEAINYIQHWGLSRRPGTPPDAHHAWHTDTWCSTCLVLGLSRHAHHHLAPARPYTELQALPDSPRLPYGYFALAFLIAYRNRRFQSLALAELRRCGLRSDHRQTHDQIEDQGHPGPQQGVGELVADVFDGLHPGGEGGNHGGVGYR
ncbi:alkane 1-monooxygenase [Methylomarinovum caldicuralii]|uniref:Alkane 1-monooxygenase n=1 Tax=Methylomarinovum caldicuralii TaxID=438856 RepID=A0AAU9C379_9GAMM|nr:alkane 1-monooxygenase [Methylomarinovum caldicuralii]